VQKKMSEKNREEKIKWEEMSVLNKAR